MTRIDYFVLPWYKKVLFRVAEFFKALGMGIAHFFMSIPGALAKFFKKFGRGFAWLGRTFVHGGILTKLSYIVMGAGSLFRGQIIKGLMYLAAEVAYFGFMIDTGFGFLAGLRNLGTVQRGWHFDESLASTSCCTAEVWSVLFFSRSAMAAPRAAMLFFFLLMLSPLSHTFKCA